MAMYAGQLTQEARDLLVALSAEAGLDTPTGQDDALFEDAENDLSSVERYNAAAAGDVTALALARQGFGLPAIS